MKSLITAGRCSACGAPAERARSGVWWHQDGSGCGLPTARFEPGDPAATRQQTSPRNRQINHPGRDR